MNQIGKTAAYPSSLGQGQGHGGYVPQREASPVSSHDTMFLSRLSQNNTNGVIANAFIADRLHLQCLEEPFGDRRIFEHHFGQQWLFGCHPVSRWQIWGIGDVCRAMGWGVAFGPRCGGVCSPYPESGHDVGNQKHCMG